MMHPEGEKAIPLKGDRKGSHPTPLRQCGVSPGWRVLALKGDRKGPHPAPHLPRPYNDVERDITEQRIIVRAGEVWSGVGTLAGARGG